MKPSTVLEKCAGCGSKQSMSSAKMSKHHRPNPKYFSQIWANLCVRKYIHQLSFEVYPSVSRWIEVYLDIRGCVWVQLGVPRCPEVYPAVLMCTQEYVGVSGWKQEKPDNQTKQNEKPLSA